MKFAIAKIIGCAVGIAFVAWALVAIARRPFLGLIGDDEL